MHSPSSQYMPLSASYCKNPIWLLVLWFLPVREEHHTHTHTQTYTSTCTHTHTHNLYSSQVVPCTISSSLFKVRLKWRKYQAQKTSMDHPNHLAEKETGTFTRRKGHDLLKHHLHGEKYSPHSCISFFAVSFPQWLLRNSEQRWPGWCSQLLPGLFMALLNWWHWRRAVHCSEDHKRALAFSVTWRKLDLLTKGEGGVLFQ